MSESFNLSEDLLFFKDFLIQFVSSEKQKLLSFRIFIRILTGDVLSKGNFFTTFLKVVSETYWEKVFCLVEIFP